jgi:hypothetical protein
MAAETRNYSEAEWNALDKKLDNPDEQVNCPRCGNDVSYKEVGNSISVKCSTEGCIFGGIRGL